MTEAEWVTSTNRVAVLEFISNFASGRKARLLAISFCRHSWPAWDSSTERQFFDIADRIADREIVEEEVIAALNKLEIYRNERGRESEGRSDLATSTLRSLLITDFSVVADTNCCVVISGTSLRYPRGWDPSMYRWHLEQLSLIRDIFGNPFHPVTFDPHWRTSDTIGIARGIYDDRAFERMPILADALMDAGCDDEQVLSHCRGAEPHVRGCWVVDLVLGKE